jgi:hypothetical protein
MSSKIIGAGVPKDRKRKTRPTLDLTTVPPHGASKQSARATLANNSGRGGGAIKGPLSKSSRRPCYNYDGWMVNPKLEDYSAKELEKVYALMKPGLFPKVFHKNNITVVSMPAPEGSKVSQIIQVVKTSQIPKNGITKDTKLYSPKAFTCPLLVVYANMTGIGRVTLDQPYAPTDMLTLKRMVTVTTYIPDEMRKICDLQCQYPAGLYSSLFKKSLVETSNTVDRFLFDKGIGDANLVRKEARSEEIIRSMQAKEEEADETRITEAAFSQYRAERNNGVKENYRCCYKDDPSHPGEYLMTITMPVFSYSNDRAAKKKAKPPVFSLENMHAMFNEVNMGVEFENEKDREMALSMFIRDKMIASGYTYHEHEYDTIAGPIRAPAIKPTDVPNGVALTPEEEKKRAKDYIFKLNIIKRGALAQFAVGIRGVAALTFYGTKMVGGRTIDGVGKSWCKLITSRDLGDLDMVNEEYLMNLQCESSLEDFINPPQLKSVIKQDAFTAAMGYTGAGAEEDSDGECEDDAPVDLADLTPEERAKLRDEFDPDASSSDDEAEEEEEEEVPVPVTLPVVPPTITTSKEVETELEIPASATIGDEEMPTAEEVKDEDSEKPKKKRVLKIPGLPPNKKRKIVEKNENKQ